MLQLGKQGKSVKWEVPEKKLSDNVGNETMKLHCCHSDFILEKFLV